LKIESLPSYAKSGSKFQTITIDVPNYLVYLMDTFKQIGGKVVRASVQHVSQLLDGGFGTSAPDTVIICAGIGARGLGGVEDETVFPIRGQTVLMRAPWIKFGRTCSNHDGLWTYIIPRRSGEVCCFQIQQQR
jgi:glycine/D-amino acid oxidase-like deaminating enzyme